MSKDREISITLSEEEAYLWIKLCRTLADDDLDAPKSLVSICDRLSVKLTRALTHTKAS